MTDTGGMSLEQFYGDRTRRDSPERSFGSGWRSRGRNRWSVSWISDTGELATFAPARNTYLGLDAGLSVGEVVFGIGAELLTQGVLHATAASKREVEVLLVEPDEDVLVSILAGWEDHLADPDGLDWLRAVCADARAG